MDLQLLGPVRALAAGRALPIKRPQQRCVLAALAVDAGRMVPVDVLIDRVWDGARPPRVDRTLHTHISRIRRLLRSAEEAGDGGARLVRDPGGYVLQIDVDRVDLHRFRTLVALGQDRNRPASERVVHLRQALDLWHDHALADLRGEWPERTRETWRRQWLHAVSAWAEAEVSTGNPAPVIELVTPLVGEHPLDEPLAAALIHALYAAGRGAEALDLYATTQRHLADQLGADPGPLLQNLHRAILRGGSPTIQSPVIRSPAIAGGPAVGGNPAGEVDRPAVEAPRQLPTDVRGYAGRREQLARLDAILTADVTEPNAIIIAVSGTAGVGKSALAVHWAHRVADQFPDGQLYVNLRGFDPSGRTMSSAEAIRGFLDALGVAPELIPASLDAQAGLYRSLVAGKRVLVLLDNARDGDHARPLLPGPPACTVVTSRNQLTGLVAAEGAHPLAVDVLERHEARELLIRRLGEDRVATEPDAVEEIITACARLPLALGIAAARAQQTGFPLIELAGELQTGQRLDALDGGEPSSRVRAVFSWSYRALTPGAARLFRLLGVQPGPELSSPAAASLAALPRPRARALLAELARANLIVEHAPGRYSFHDLLRAYATDLAHRTSPGDDPHAAVHRLLDHYVHSAHEAHSLLAAQLDPVTPESPLPGVEPETFDASPPALAWFDAERRTLLAAVEAAAGGGFDGHAWRLAWAMDSFLQGRGHWHDYLSSQRTALAAAERLNSRVAQGYVHRGLGRSHALLGEYVEAHDHYRTALALFTELNDHVAQGRALLGTSWIFDRQGQGKDALRRAQQALAAFEFAGHLAGRARALNAVGWCYAKLGDHRRAITCCEESLTLHRSLADPGDEAVTWDSLGYAHLHLGQLTRARTCYERAVALSHACGSALYEASALHRLGDVLLRTSDRDAACAAYRNSLTILERLAHRDAEQVRTKLRALVGHDAHS